MEGLSIGGLFAAGVLTFASPCVLPLVPLYLSFLTGASIAEVRAGRAVRMVPLALAFSLGLGVVFVALGMAAGVLGASVDRYRSLWVPLAGAALLVFGLKLLGVISVPFLDRELRPALGRMRQGSGLFGAFGLGAAFALGWTPCVGPLLGGALSLAATASTNPWQAGGYLAAYAAGLTLPLVAIAAAGASALRWLERVRPHLGKLEKASGAALVAVAVAMLTGVLFAPVSLAPVEPARTVAVAPPPARHVPIASAEISSPAGEGAFCATPVEGGACALPEEGTGAAAPTAAPWAPLAGARVLAFESQTCSVCERMKPVVARVETECSGRAPFDRVDVGTPEGLSEARSRGVRGVPTYVFLAPDGREVSRLIGEHPGERLRTSIEAAAGKTCG